MKQILTTSLMSIWVNIKVIRIFNTYGPNMNINDGRVISNFIAQALRGEEITIYGDGTQSRSFCFVDDLVEGMYNMMETPSEVTGPINLGNPSEITIKEVAEKVIELTGSGSCLIFEDLPEDDPLKRKPDITKAKETLGWEPTVTLEKGLIKTINYFQ